MQKHVQEKEPLVQSTEVCAQGMVRPAEAGEGWHRL